MELQTARDNSRVSIDICFDEHGKPVTKKLNGLQQRIMVNGVTIAKGFNAKVLTISHADNTLVVTYEIWDTQKQPIEYYDEDERIMKSGDVYSARRIRNTYQH